MAMRVCQGILTVLLLVDVIMITTVPRIRQEEGPPGIASAGWTTLMAAWCVITDRLVAWGKREEEERLTGRPETRRSLKEWLAVLVATIFLVIYIIIVVLMTGTLVLRSRDASLPWEGERYYVDDNKFQIHLTCIGNATEDKHGNRSPTIILEAAEEPSEYDFEHWLYAAYKNGTIDRYCYWDRPGYAWSDNAPSPHSAGDAADELSAIMNQRNESGPYILVSAGYGSIVSRIFSSRHIQQIEGIMMIDPLHEDLLPRVGDPTRGFFIWAWGVISPLGIQRIAGALFKGRTREDRVYGKEAYQGGKFIKAQLQENLMAKALTTKEIRNARTIQTPDTPLVIVSSGLQVRNDDEWEDKQQDLTKITDNLVSWDVVKKAPHFVWRTLEGRSVMEKRLGQLVKKAMKNKSLEED